MAQYDRRLEVAAAAWRVIVREGLERASMRAIAQEMSCTTGVVMHYFRNKEELILFALHQVTARLQAAMETAPVPVTGAERLIQRLLVFLPLDESRQHILRVWVAFLGYAVGQDTLMQQHQQSAAQLRDLMLQELMSLQAKGLLRTHINPAIEANALLALVNGISLDSLIQVNRLSREQQEGIIRRYVNGLLLNPETAHEGTRIK